MANETLAAAPVRVVEQIGDWRSAALVIDREAGIVRNVALAGLESKNGYRYAEESLRRAVPLYADKPVFIDHAANVSRPQERSTRDLAGTIVNPRYAEGRIRGDIQTLGTEAGRTFLALAESSSHSVGMSHVVLVRQNHDRSVVEEIHEVVSVDAVAFPATTSTLAEQSEEVAVEPPVYGSLESLLSQIDAQLPRRVRELTGDADAVCERIAVFPGHVVVRVEGECFRFDWRIQEERVRLANQWQPAGDVAAGAESWHAFVHEADGDEESPMQSAVMLAEQLKAAEAKSQALQTQVEELVAERELADRRDAVERLLADAELPLEVVSESFRRQLLESVDDAEREALLQDRVELYETLKVSVPTSSARVDAVGDETDEEALVRVLAAGRR